MSVVSLPDDICQTLHFPDKPHDRKAVCPSEQTALDRGNMPDLSFTYKVICKLIDIFKWATGDSKFWFSQLKTVENFFFVSI